MVLHMENVENSRISSDVKLLCHNYDITGLKKYVMQTSACYEVTKFRGEDKLIFYIFNSQLWYFAKK